MPNSLIAAVLWTTHFLLLPCSPRMEGARDETQSGNRGRKSSGGNVHGIDSDRSFPNLNRAGVVVRFIIGLGNAQDDVVSELRAEHEEMRDLALLPGLEDRYNRLTQKLVASLTWAYQTYTFDYLLKVHAA